MDPEVTRVAPARCPLLAGEPRLAGAGELVPESSRRLADMPKANGPGGQMLRVARAALVERETVAA